MQFGLASVCTEVIEGKIPQTQRVVTQDYLATHGHNSIQTRCDYEQSFKKSS